MVRMEGKRRFTIGLQGLEADLHYITYLQYICDHDSRRY